MPKGNAQYPQAFVAEFIARKTLGERHDVLCRDMGINRKTGQQWWARHHRQRAQTTDGSPPPKTRGQVRQHPAARRAHDDFAYFRLVCFGYKTPPWQAAAIEELREAVESGRRDFVCMNVFSGAGKTSLMQHFICWLVARNRTIRTLWISASDELATMRVREIRLELSRVEPWHGRVEDISTGRAVKPRYCMTQLFGRFRPSASHGTKWGDSEFTVSTVGDMHNPEGPPSSGATVTAAGRRTSQMGLRVNLIVGDDIWTEKEENNPETGDEVKRYFDRTVESRIQPNGVLVLVMQRMGANDLSKHVLDERVPLRDPVTGQETGWGPKYRHIVFPAHMDDLCDGTHPDGRPPHDPRDPVMGRCLLDPLAFGPDDYLRMRGKPDVFLVMYQQRDANPRASIIREVWVTGGKDPDGEYRGCLDFDRGLWELPAGVDRRDLIAACAVDVGQAKGFWGLYASVFMNDLDSQAEWVLDVEQRRMPAGSEHGFLDYDFERRCFVGLLENWYQRSVGLGVPFTHVVAEQNAAQRHLFQRNNIIENWQMARNCRIVLHSTTTWNKNSKETGLEALLPIRYQLGAPRLPWAPGEAQNRMRVLVNEAKGYKNGWPTDDVLMAQWMLWLNRRKIARPVVAVPNRDDVPGFVKQLA